MLDNEKELILRLNKGDETAFTYLYDKYLDMVYGFLCHLLKDEAVAEDMTQFCFMQVWIHRRKIKPGKNFPAYLYVIAKNAAYKEFRRNLTADTYVEHAFQTRDRYSRPDEGNLDFQLIRKEVDRVIRELPESRRQIYIMSRVEGKKTAEIAEQLGISPKTVDAQISRVKLALRKAISEIVVVSCLSILTDGQSSSLEVPHPDQENRSWDVSLHFDELRP